MAAPVIRIFNPAAPENRQEALLNLTPEAQNYKDKKKVFPNPPQELCDEATALAHAEMQLRADGIPMPSRLQCLGKLLIMFGQYIYGSFHWLLENDVGYVDK